MSDSVRPRSLPRVPGTAADGPVAPPGKSVVTTETWPRRTWPTVLVNVVLPSEPGPSGSPRATRRQRVLDGLAGLAQRLAGLANWLAGPDPGFNRLRTVCCATLTIAAAIGAEW